MFYLDSEIKEMCCGCQACKMICPTQCISMYEDIEGFTYPKKTEDLCIDCGLCEKVCPFIQKDKIDHNETEDSPKAYFATNKNSNVLFDSASGGVFSSVANAYCKGDFVIFGVQFDNDFNVIHTYTDSLKDAQKYRKSKYVQSDIKDSYKKAEKFLKLGKKVLFTGTPCQIGGLRLYLGKEYEDLFCLDLVCHGVPSQSIFDQYIEYIEAKYKGKITDFTFRHKTINKQGKWNSKNIKFNINGKDIIHEPSKDTYLRGFHGELFYRPSCYNCNYADPSRVSDITMADFWGVDKLFPEEDVHKGVSVIIVNTEKGQEILKELSNTMNLKEVDLNYVINSNGQLKRPANKHEKRDEFFRLRDNIRFDKAVNSCIPKISLIRRIVSKVLPQRTKNVIKKIIK